MRDYEVAGAITSTVRDWIFFVMNECDKLGYKWIYEHTDSTFINAKKDTAEELVRYLNKRLKEYSESKGYRVSPTLEYAGYYKVGYIHSPARYVLVPENAEIDEDDKWEVKGMNFFRSETPEELADIEKELIKLKMKGADSESLIEYLGKRIVNLPNVETQRLGILKPLTKPIEKYGRKLKDGKIGGYPSHIKALMLAQEKIGLEIEVGEKFLVLPIITNETVGKRKIRRKRVDIAFSPKFGLPKDFKIDWETYLKSNLFGKIYKLFDIELKELMSKCEKFIKAIENV